MRGEILSTRRKTSRSRVENKPNFSLHMTPAPGSEPGTNWWKASALTTAPILHPQNEMNRGLLSCTYIERISILKTDYGMSALAKT